MWRDLERAALEARLDAEADVWAAVARVHRRLLVGRLAVAHGAGLTIASAFGLGWTAVRGGGPALGLAVTVGVVVVAAALWADVRLRRRARALSWIDGHVPALRNQLVTLFEVATGALDAPTYVRHRLGRATRRALSDADLSEMAPLTPGVAACVAGAVVAAAWLATATGAWSTDGYPASEAAAGPPHSLEGAGSAAASIDRVRLVVTPPPHTGLDPFEAVDPDRVSVLVGSRVAVVVDAVGGRVVMADHRGSATVLSRSLAGRFEGEYEALETGYLALHVEGEDTAGHPVPARRLIGVHASGDRSPLVRLTTPGHDLVLADGRRDIALVVDAEDDFGLASLTLAYTIASGSGETFDFTEGELPLAVVRDSPRRWQATGQLPLSALGVQPGDAVVYRAVAADRQPGPARFGASETYLVEIAPPRLAAAADFELPDDQARFALSQQMVLVKTERLHARRASLGRETLVEASMAIAAEQRMVRAEFVFMMGGDVEDEEEEAAHSHEIQEGRLENQGRQELIRAIQFMSVSERALNTADTAEALPAQRSAIEMLQRAFGRSRYILRTLPVRARIDASRRLTGELAEVPRSIGRDAADGAVDEHPVVAILARLVELAARVSSTGSFDEWREPMAAMAERVLALDPASERLARAAQGVLEAARGPALDSHDTRRALDAAASEVRAWHQRAPTAWTPPAGAVAGELAEASRPAGGRR
ncbi:MAG: hypothetical protein KJ066_05460 [Acidobacteria bacterium]|nr:hypothetical protein [Acidobacteriota bacterium]